MTRRKKKKGPGRQRNVRLEELQRQYNAIASRRAALDSPVGRLLSELDRWLRMELFSSRSGRSKLETALIFLARDSSALSEAIADIGQSMIKLEAIREAELQRSYGQGIGHG